MEDKCPKCGSTLITRTITKQMGLGSIDYPVALVCPNCGWNRDLTGASDIVSKPLVAETVELKKEEKKPPVARAPLKTPAIPGTSSKTNTLITVALAIVVLAGILWAFYPPAAKQTPQVPSPTPTPIVTVPATPVSTATPIPDATPTGKTIGVKIERNRGFFSLVQGTMKIKPGDEIIWTNEGTDPVTLVSSGGLFDPKLLDNGKRTNYTFKKPGTYGFYLKENMNLTGTIVVEP